MLRRVEEGYYFLVVVYLDGEFRYRYRRIRLWFRVAWLDGDYEVVREVGSVFWIEEILLCRGRRVLGVF